MYNLDCFNLIYSLKNIKKTELILTEDDHYCIDNFYKIVKGIVKKKGFEKAVKIYQIETGEIDMYIICDILTQEIIRKYGK